MKTIDLSMVKNQPQKRFLPLLIIGTTLKTLPTIFYALLTNLIKSPLRVLN